MNRSEAETMLAQLQRGRSQSAMRAKTYVDDLDVQLEDVIMWCRRYIDVHAVRRCLRPARLSPHPLPASRWRAVEDLAATRSAELARAPDLTLDGNIYGRLIVYFPDRDRAGGAAETVSKGFFDVHNAPPCGTWISYFDAGDHKSPDSGYLLAWVPKVFVSLAGQGIAANPEQCIMWLDETNLPLRHVIPHLRVHIYVG